MSLPSNKITIVGVGKLGLGFALLLEKVGYEIMGIDIIQDYVDKLNNKTATFTEPRYNELLQKSSHFIASTSLEDGINFSDTIFIIVQTPNSGGEKFYDHSILSNVLLKINKLKPVNKDIIIGCTIMPKYIDDIGIHLISDCVDCHLSYNPEFVAQGDIIRGFSMPDIILVGTNNSDLVQKLTTIYKRMTTSNPKFFFLKPIEAEIVKISLNSYITTKISFANMLSDLCDKLGADKIKILEAIGSDSRIGNKYFRPGHSFGGPCFPRDTKACKQLMDQNEIPSDLLIATTKYNEDHILFQVNQLLQENKEEYIIENVCYKENSKIPIIEESAKLKIAKYLVRNGKKVTIVDTEEILQEVKKDFGKLFTYQIQESPVNVCQESSNNIMEKVYEYWNTRPCNIRHSNKEIGTKEYFEEVTQRKYFVEPHILKFADFARYRGKNVLEVGCGIGTAAQSFAENGAIYTGIDLSDYSIDIAKQRFKIFGLEGNIYSCDVEKMTSAYEHTFDLVYSFGVLHHTLHPNIAIKNIWRMLKPNGEFKMMLYASNSFKNFMIKDGLDQYEAQSGVPIAYTYSREHINNLLSGLFTDIEIFQTHIFPYKIEEYKQYKYVKHEYFETMPQELFECLERNLGWHLCITCVKKN